MERFLYDLRHAWRQNARRPLFLLIAVLSIAIGIGANTTILTVINTLLIRPPSGISGVDRVVEVTRTTGGRGRDTFSWPEYQALRTEGADVFAHLAAWNGTEFSHAGTDGGERLSGMTVSHNYFAVMGVQPLRGRFFLPDEDAVPMTHPVAVVSESFWRHRLGARTDVIGSHLVLNRHTFTVVGVAPAAFRGHVIGFSQDVWIPMMMHGVVRPGFDSWDSQYSSWFTAVGRLREGVALEQARGVAQAVMARRPQRSDDVRNARSAAVDPLTAVPAAGRGPIAIFLSGLLAMAGIVLLVACANVAGMLLARAAGREREIAVRLALGSGRGRLVRQLVAESVVLFAIGGATGVALALWLARVLSRLPLPTPVAFDLNFAPDARVLAAGLGLALLTGVVFGLAPALQATRPDLTTMLKATGFRSGRGGRLRAAFVMGQVGLSLILLFASALLLRSLQMAAAVPVGFDGAGVRVVPFNLEIDGYDEPRGLAFVRNVQARLLASGGVSSAAAALDLPLDFSRSEQQAFVTSPVASEGGWVMSEFNIVSWGYFDALRIRVVEGRPFGPGDVAGAQPVAIVSRTFAQEVWPGTSAIGQLIRRDSASQAFTVIGVVDDVKNSTLTEDASRMYYLPLDQAYTPRLQFIARAAPGADAAPVLRTVLREVDPQLSTGLLQSFTAVSALSLLPQRIAATLTTVLGAIALLLSALGVYGVVAFTVAQRTREIGVRMALGANRLTVVRSVVRGGLRLALPGLIIGTLAGLALSRVLGAFLLGLSPVDPVTFLGVPAVLLTMVALACWVPARRAAAVQPTEALRAE